MPVRTSDTCFLVALAIVALLALSEPAWAQQDGNEPVTFEANGDQPTFVEPRNAEELFSIYSAENYDASVVALYADDARILHTRRYPNGTARKIEIPIAEWKSLIVEVMPVAKELGDTNTYSHVRYVPEGKRICIRAVRYNARKDYESPIQLLVGTTSSGLWRIFEEVTESRP